MKREEQLIAENSTSNKCIPAATRNTPVKHGAASTVWVLWAGYPYPVFGIASQQFAEAATSLEAALLQKRNDQGVLPPGPLSHHRTVVHPRLAFLKTFALPGGSGSACWCCENKRRS